MERWKITGEEFESALHRYPTDELLYAWFRERVAPEDVQATNQWLLGDAVENLDRQDAEEVAPAERR